MVREMLKIVGIVILLGAALVVGADADGTLRLGGIGIGTSILDVVKMLGPPDVVQTTDYGHFWQWAQARGLDREILTDDDLVVKSILVAPAQPASTAQPPELPVLGDPIDEATRSATASGAVSVHRGGDTWSVWRWNGGVLVLEMKSSLVVRLRAFDEATATSRGYFGPVAAAPEHHAPILEKQYVPAFVPDGSGNVIVRVEVDARGKATNARVVVSSGDREIDRFEIDSMSNSTFAPASCAGVPCAGVYLDDGGVSR